MIYGHEEVVLDLERNLPRACIFQGPKSVGKTTVAEYVRDHYGVSGSDYLSVEELDSDSVREAMRVSRVVPARDMRLIVLQMDGAPRRLWDTLLLAIEDAPETTRFILITSRELSATLHSRCSTYYFSYLDSESMEKVLGKVLPTAVNLDPMVQRSGGQVYRAFLGAKRSENIRQVIDMLGAFHGRDSAPLERATKVWSWEHTNLLETWCQEMISGRWRVFSHSDLEIDDKKLGIRILTALKADIRPRLLIHSRIMDIWKEYIL